MTLDLDHLKKLAMAAEDSGSWGFFSTGLPQGVGPCGKFISEISPATVLELIRLAEKGKACEKKASESHLVGGVPGNHNW